MKEKLINWVFMPLLKVLCIFAIVVGISQLLSFLGVGNDSIILIFILGVFFTVVATGSYFWGLSSALISVMLFNYLYTVPTFTFLIYSRSDIFLLVFFLITVLVIGAIMSNLQHQKYLAEESRSNSEEIRLAMEKEKLRNTLLKSVAHDLRSPLTALSGASSLLSDNFDTLSDDEKKSLAVDISEETVWLTNLVENILNMTRINESKLVIHKEYEVVDDIVEIAVTHMKKLLKSRILVVNLPPDIISVPVDGKLISQVLINIFDNAIKFTTENDIITLDVTSDKKYAIFRVTDTGSNIDFSVGDDIFQSFVTTERGMTDSQKGTGLGLSICKAVIEAHKGSISCENIKPHGASFVFTLPLEDKYNE